MRAKKSDVERAHAIYTKRTLAVYDWCVLRVMNRYFWGCENEILLDFYRSHVTGNHLEVGVGTGYYPSVAFPKDGERLAFLDLNTHCLDRAMKLLADRHPERIMANVLEPIPQTMGEFSSISLYYVLHCLPGRLEEKAARVFDNLLPLLAGNGAIYGATVLGKDIQRNLRARIAMHLLNRRRIISNAEDSLGGLMEALSARFRVFEVEVHGCVVLFWGRGLRDAYREQHPGV